MPQQNRQKKKGRAPAHQNAFAFRHNPRSKTTAKILASPNQHVCQRCHDKIEWRKRYRKYKPLTQPARCNLCQQRSVRAAYHTICTKCTVSDQAFNFMQHAQAKQGMNESEEEHQQGEGGTVDEEQIQKDLASLKDEATESNDNDETTESIDDTDDTDDTALLAASLSQRQQHQRVCAMCVKDLALPDEDDDTDAVAQVMSQLGPMSLRQRKAVERQLAKLHQHNDDRGSNEDEEEIRVEEQDQDKDSDDFDQQDEGSVDDEEDDPFLKALGGNRPLTGAAYQEMLLARQHGAEQQQFGNSL